MDLKAKLPDEIKSRSAENLCISQILSLLNKAEYFSEADIKEAYVKVKAKLKHDDQITLLTAIFNKMLILILPLVAIYGLGWIFGWIYRGFSKG